MTTIICLHVIYTQNKIKTCGPTGDPETQDLSRVGMITLCTSPGKKIQLYMVPKKGGKCMLEERNKKKEMADLNM